VHLAERDRAAGGGARADADQSLSVVGTTGRGAPEEEVTGRGACGRAHGAGASSVSALDFRLGESDRPREPPSETLRSERAMTQGSSTPDPAPPERPDLRDPVGSGAAQLWWYRDVREPAPPPPPSLLQTLRARLRVLREQHAVDALACFGLSAL